MLRSIIVIFLLISNISVIDVVGINPQTYYYNSNLNNDEDDQDVWVIFIVVGDSKKESRNINLLTNIFLENGCLSSQIFILNDEQATKEKILTKPFIWLDNQNISNNDIIFFYFSMHGSKIEDQLPFDEPDNLDEYLVPYDYDFESGNYIIDDELNEKISLINNQNIVLVFETCYSGGMIDGKSDLAADGRIIITSADVNEPSWSIYFPSSWLFPHYLIKGLLGPADENNDGFISVEESFYYAEIPTVFRSSILAFFYSLIPLIPHDFFAQHPQLFDGWPSIENNSKDLLLFELRN